MKEVVLSLKRVYQLKIYLLVTISITAFVMYLYYLAVVANVPFGTFINSNTAIFTLLQIFFSFTNALLIGVAITLFIYVFKLRQKAQSASIAQTFASLFFSVATTGCYVCGSVLLPSIGVAASFTSLPFGGLEIKFLTALLLIYSIRQYADTILETCKIQSFKDVTLHIGSKDVSFSTKIFYKARPYAITGAFIFLILFLPVLTSSLGFSGYIGATSGYTCEAHK